MFTEHVWNVHNAYERLVNTSGTYLKCTNVSMSEIYITKTMSLGAMEMYCTYKKKKKERKKEAKKERKKKSMLSCMVRVLVYY